MGADWTLDVTQSTSDQRLRAVRAATGGRGPDIVIEASGNPAAVPEGCDLVRDAGRYVIVGQYTDHGDIALIHIRRSIASTWRSWAAGVPISPMSTAP